MKNIYEVLLAEFSEPINLNTGVRHIPFTIYSEDGKLKVQNSKNNHRLIDRKQVQNFYDEYKKTGSLSPKNYLDITRHSSYLLAAMHHLKANGSL
ncbi:MULTISPECIES: hypothetical protein [unclassified Acinetobacter]|uniref:hypothetical protein n=1 Tax=unclassified Acinetobacter TaxID=196816 RepID=UPI0015D28712|nr:MULTISPECIES: hypothetical protein [unclassified Acinetobacter]